MGIVATHAGRSLLAQALTGVGPGTGNSYYVRLFKAGYSPTPSSDVGDFTEATFGGYVYAARTWGESAGPTLETDDEAVDMHPDGFVFDCTSDPETIYGWYMVDPASGHVVFAEEYAVPHVLEVGSRHRVFIKISTGQCA